MVELESLGKKQGHEKLMMNVMSARITVSASIYICRTGAGNGGTAAWWVYCTMSETSRTFLVVVWDSLVSLLLVLLEGIAGALGLLELAAFTVNDEDVLFERFVEADAITEVNTPDSLKAWMITCVIYMFMKAGKTKN